MNKNIEIESAHETVRKRYLFFAEKEVRERCPIYEKLALAIADDEDLISLIVTFPRDKRQPNLILASLRKLLGRVPDFSEARELMLDDPDRLTQIVFTHGTQTNEPGRCATLLPLFCQLPQPLALLEIGASAGLCLIPDLYNYDYGSTTLSGAPEFPDFVLSCAAGATVPLPAALPLVVWRAGLDTNPLDLRNPEQKAWLETLVWPSETDRLRRLQQAMALAEKEELRIESGDLHTDDLDRLIARAPKDATLVIFHSAVLSYTLDQSRRDAFARRMADLTGHWISSESPALFSDFGGDLLGRRSGSDFLIALDGRPIAWADPHGATIVWIDAT
jgi:hypothetical protein